MCDSIDIFLAYLVEKLQRQLTLRPVFTSEKLIYKNIVHTHTRIQTHTHPNTWIQNRKGGHKCAKHSQYCDNNETMTKLFSQPQIIQLIVYWVINKVYFIFIAPPKTFLFMYTWLDAIPWISHIENAVAFRLSIDNNLS